jgi:hypothetical protein
VIPGPAGTVPDSAKGSRHSLGQRMRRAGGTAAAGHLQRAPGVEYDSFESYCRVYYVLIIKILSN